MSLADIARRLMGRIVPRVVAADVRRDALHWVECAATPFGLWPRRAGRLPREGDETDAALTQRAKSVLAGAELVLAVRDPDLVIQRLELPGLSAGDARRVASRRLEQLHEELPLESNTDFVISQGAPPRVGWLIGCPAIRAEEQRLEWEEGGHAIRQLVGLPLALASLACWLPPPAEGELVAIFDLDDVHGSCVILDARGWVFSREIIRKSAVDELSAHDRYERLATEVRRTIHYVESVLKIGAVTRLLLSGDDAEADAIAAELESSLSLAVCPIGLALEHAPLRGLEAGDALALGLATAARRGGGDLLCMERRREWAQRSARRRLALAAVVLGLLAWAGLAHHAWSWSSARERIASLDERWDATESRRRAVESVSDARQRARALEAFLDARRVPRPDWRAALDSLGLLLPDDALVERMRVDAEDGAYTVELHVEFRGEDLAAAAQNASRFQGELRRAPLWVLRSSEQRQSPRGPGARPDAFEGARLRYRIEAALAAVAPPADAASTPPSGGEAPADA